MSIFTNYSKIGKNGAEDKFLKAFRKSKDWSGDTRAKNLELLDGAIQAFREGRPKNIQAALINAKTEGNYYCGSSTAFIISKLTENSADKLADIKRVFANTSEEDKKSALSNALHDALEHGQSDRLAFFSLLLEAGAEANAAIDGYPGKTIATAIRRKHPISVIKLLHDNGGSLEDAGTTIRSLDYNLSEKETLERYQKELTGESTAPETAQPAAKEAGLCEVLREIRDELREITRRLPPPAEPAANTNQPHEAKAPQKTKLSSDRLRAF